MQTARPKLWMSASPHMPEASTGKRRIIPKAVIRRLMMASGEGGRKYCDKCRRAFSVRYIITIEHPMRPDQHFCRDCAPPRQLD